MRKTNMCRSVSILLVGWASCASVAFAQGMTSQGDSGYEYGHFRSVGFGEHQLRGHAGTKQQQQALANPGFHLRPARHNRDVLRR